MKEEEFYQPCDELPEEQLVLRSLKRKIGNIQTIQESYPDLISGLVEPLMFFGKAISSRYAVQHSERETSSQILLQQVAENIEESFHLISDRKFDQGFSLMRIASEAVRDADVISRNPQLEKLYWKRFNKKHEYEYRKTFKFCGDLDNGSNSARGVYKFCSSFATHGQIISGISSRKNDQFSNERYVVLEIPLEKVIEMILLWAQFSAILIKVLFSFLKKIEASEDIEVSFKLGIDAVEMAIQEARIRLTHN